MGINISKGTGVFFILILLASFAVIGVICADYFGTVKQNASDGVLLGYTPSYNHQVSPIKLNDFASRNRPRERWSYFANLTDKYGQHYSVVWFFSRIGPESQEGNSHINNGWANDELFISDAIVSTQDKVWQGSRFARGGINQAGVMSSPFHLFIDEWFLKSNADSLLPNDLHLGMDDFSISLTNEFNLSKNKPAFQIKSLTHSSMEAHLFVPFIDVQGELLLDQKKIVVTGSAWFSKNASSNENFSNWDWLVFRLDADTIVSIQCYQQDENILISHMTLIKSDGRLESVSGKDYSVSIKQSRKNSSGKVLPIKWFVSIDSYKSKVFLRPLNQHVQTYSTGPMAVQGSLIVSGTHKGTGFFQYGTE